MKNKILLVTLSAMMASVSFAQDLKIHGNVKSADDNLPLMGVSVMVKGSQTGVITDDMGNYSISVSKGDVLVFSFVGMAGQEVPVTSQGKVDIVLSPDVKVLEDVVVTALGIKRSEKALGYAVQKVSGDVITKVPGVEAGSALTGKVAGLLVGNSSDFAASPTMTIRGETPLLVIDGVPYANKTMSDIASEDIESLSVLKGSTASALYGFRGANGAILVTTKNGSENNEGLSVDLSTNTMFSVGYLAVPEVQTVYGRGDNGTYDVNSLKSWGVPMDGRILEQWDPVTKSMREYEYLPVGKDNFKNFLTSGYVTNNNLNVAYKTKNASLRSSFNWVENDGVYPNQKLDRFTYTFGGDFTYNKFNLSSNLSFTKKKTPNVGGRGYQSYEPMYAILLSSSADYDIRDYRDYWLEENISQNWTYQNKTASNNPYFDAYEKTNSLDRNIFNADLTATYDITKWLKATFRTGLDFFSERGELKVSKGSNVASGWMSIPGYANSTWNGQYTGAYMVGLQQGLSINTDFILSGDKEFGNFGVEYLLGGTVFYDEDKLVTGSTNNGLTVPGYYSLAASVDPAKVGEVRSAQQVNSIYGRLGLSWNKMLYAEFTGRNDWTSTLPSSTRSYFYPSISGSFVISELLPQTKDWLDLLKVRSSWTLTKTPPTVYAINSDFDIYSDTWNGMTGAGYPGRRYPLDVLPQSASTYEVGLQSIFFKNRLSVDLTYYSKRSFDLLKEAQTSPTTGYTSNYINIDEERTRRGFEIALGGTPIRTKDWEWNINTNWSTSASYYTKLDETYSEKKPWVKVGERTDAFVSRDFVRDPEGNLVFSNGRLQIHPYTSNFGWRDPDWVWGLNTSVRYKNFTLYVSMDGVIGGITGSRTESYMWQNGVHPNSVTPERALDVANPGSKNYIGEGVKVVSGEATYDLNGNIITDTRVFAPNDVPTTYQQYIMDLHNSSAFDWDGYHTWADVYSKTFFKIRELSVSYDIPKNILSSFKLSAASVGLSAQNIFLWAKDFKYSDPDGGSEDLADPACSYLGFNIKLTF